MKILLLYVIFAVLATISNIASQDLVVRLYTGPLSIPASIVIGTAVGLVVKYVLDKRYIFHFKPRGTLHDGQVFLAYTGMGLMTTAIFWLFEYAFHLFFLTKEARYLGAVLGLALGYFIKYRLDKKFVFLGEPAR